MIAVTSHVPTGPWVPGLATSAALSSALLAAANDAGGGGGGGESVHGSSVHTGYRL